MWFSLWDSFNGRCILVSLMMLVFAFIQSRQANVHINAINEENRHDFRKQDLPLAPVVTVVVAIIFIVLALALPINIVNNK